MPETTPELPPSGKLDVHRGWGGIISNTIGRVGAIPTDIILGTPLSPFKSPSEQTAEYLKEKYQDVPWKGNVEVYLGHSPLFRQLKRLFQKERRVNFFARVAVGIPTTILSWASGKLARSDLYNPYTEIAQVYHPSTAVGMHEIGHAADYDQAKHPTLKALSLLVPGLSYFTRIKQEWNASHNAIKRIPENERQNAAKILTPAFGSYLAANIPIFSWVPIIAGHIHSRISKNTPFLNPFFKPRTAAAT